MITKNSMHVQQTRPGIHAASAGQTLLVAKAGILE